MSESTDRHQALLGAFEATASYFEWSDRRDGMSYTPSMSKRARSIELWAILKPLGRHGVEALVDQLCERVTLFANRLQEEGFRLRNQVVFTQVLVSCGDDDRLTEATLEIARETGVLWCGGSKFGGRSVIRLSVCSWATTEQDIEQSVAALVQGRAVARTALP